MARGELVSDAILLGMLEDRFSRPDTASGFILDGYPRRLAQADALDGLLTRIRQPFDYAGCSWTCRPSCWSGVSPPRQGRRPRRRQPDIRAQAPADLTIPPRR